MIGTEINIAGPSVFIPLPIQRMMDSELTFYLTGSRRWGQAELGSDWDFFVGNSPAAQTWLSQNGFEIDFDSNYSGDSNASRVYILFGPPSIHVQLVKDVNLKREAQHIIMRWFPGFYNLPKARRKSVWQCVQHALEARG